MTQGKDKYSLWIEPKGETGEVLQALVDKLADENGAPHFVPHLTLVANIFADAAELDDIKARIKDYADKISPFAVSLTGYGYTEEEFRCLYVLAEGKELQAVYDGLSGLFPQIADEHFRALPHISLLYGKYDQGLKDTIIATNPLIHTEFTVDRFDLYLTNNPVQNWRLSQSFSLSSDA